MYEENFELDSRLVVAFSAAVVCYAAPDTNDDGVDVTDQTTPLSPATVDDDMYDDPTVEDNQIPFNPPDTSQQTVDVEDTTVPLDSSLPGTGGIPAEVFYAAGGLFIVAAVVLTFARKKAVTKG